MNTIYKYDIVVIMLILHLHYVYQNKWPTLNIYLLSFVTHKAQKIKHVYNN